MSADQITQAREAFEDHYQRDANDPSSEEMLEVWMAAWERCIAQGEKR